MSTHMAAEERIDNEYDQYEDHQDLDEFEPERRLGGLNLRDGGTDLFRGVLVALVALAVGAIVLSQGFGDDPESGAEDDSITTGELTAADPDALTTEDEADADAATETSNDPAAPDADGAMTSDAMADGESTTDPTAADGTATTVDPAQTTTTPTTAGLTDTARPASQVQVVVLNATDQQGIAGQGTELLSAANYDTVPAGNATDNIGSVILYMEGYRADAIAVSQVFTDGLDGLVQPYDPTAPPALAEDIGDAKVIVVLGLDDAIPLG